MERHVPLAVTDATAGFTFGMPLGAGIVQALPDSLGDGNKHYITEPA